MTYLVLDQCINCKYTDCALVCPVDCFYEGANMLAIHPDECIDCGLCKDECPVNAIASDLELEGEVLAKWLEVNAKYAKEWPKITKKKDPLPSADEYAEKPNKFETLFDPKPGDGDGETP